MASAHAGYRAWLDPVIRLEFGAATVLFALTGLVMGAQIIARMAFGLPMVWAEDITVFMFVWTTFLGAAVLYDRKQALAIDTFVTLLSPRMQRRVALAVDVLLLVTLIYLCKLTWDFVAIQRSMGHKLGGATGIPSYVMTLSVLLAFISMTASTVASLLERRSMAREGT